VCRERERESFSVVSCGVSKSVHVSATKQILKKGGKNTVPPFLLSTAERERTRKMAGHPSCRGQLLQDFFAFK